MGAHRHPPDEPGIHRLLLPPPLHSPHRGQLHPTQVPHTNQKSGRPVTLRPGPW